jgi:hypothetical protein
LSVSSIHESAAERNGQKKRKQADRLIDYASGAPLFCDQMGAPHVLLYDEAVPLNTRAYRWLRELMWDGEGIAIGGEALKTAVGTLAAFALRSGVVCELHTRSAFYDGAVYYQLRPGRVVRIDRDGWAIENQEAVPVVFRRVPNLKPLPDPEMGGDLDTLESFINLKSERDKRMLKTYITTLPLPHIPRPILQTTGVMGSGKTTAGRMIKRLLDPTAPETVRMDPRDFLQKASHSYIVMLDNINSIPEWGVDTLCRLVTGEADSKRSLYTDDEDFIYEMRRAVLLNGINAPTERGDAQDRTLPVELERIRDGERRSEEDLWAEFKTEHGRLLGAIFDVLSEALSEKESLQLTRRPRLADWGEYAAAVYRAMCWKEDGLRAEALFLEDWGEVVRVQNQGTLDGSPVAQAMLSFMESRNEWTGLVSDLYAKLEATAEELNINTKREKAWPKSPLWLSRRIREVLPLLRAMGLEAEIGTSRKAGTQITLTKVPTDSGPDGGSKNRDTATSTATDNPAEESASDGGGSRGSNSGYSPPSLSQPREEKAAKEEENGSKTDTGLELAANTASTASTATATKTPPLTLEQVEEYKRLRAMGKGQEEARSIARGEREL